MPAFNPLIVVDVEAAVVTNRPSWYTLYPVTPILSVDPFQLKSVEVSFVLEAMRLEGTLGDFIIYLFELILLQT